MNKKFVCTFDYGNTKEKGALFQSEELVKEFSLKEFSKIIVEFNLNMKNCTIIECSVKNNLRIKTNIPTVNVKELFKSKKFLEMNVDYSETLGMDRLVQAYYHFNEHKSKAAIIDSGTFTTVDYVDEEGFKGGFILPGLEVLKKTFQKGDLLKPHDISYTDINLNLPKETDCAIKSGLHYSFISPILNILKNYQVDQIVLTGGNTDYIKSSIENDNELSKNKLMTDNLLIHRSLKLISQKVSEL